jgi:DNA-directed RNA polymerase specialized sigma24 family protein
MTNLTTTNIHPLNKQISTITSGEIYEQALIGVRKFVGKKNDNQTLPYFGSHVSLEDLAMDAVEKVCRANPMYITKTYVRIAARCVCIDKLKSKKLRTYHVEPFEDDNTSLEDSMVGDSADNMEYMETMLRNAMDPLQQKIYDALLLNKMYIEIAEKLNISLRTLERQVQELKWLCEFLLLEVNPDENKHSLLF